PRLARSEEMAYRTMTAEQTGNTRFRYREFPPAAPLADHVLTYWRFEASVPPGETFTHHVWPDGCVSVNVVASGGDDIRRLGRRPAPRRPPPRPRGPHRRARYHRHPRRPEHRQPRPRLRARDPAAPAPLPPRARALAQGVLTHPAAPLHPRGS